MFYDYQCISCKNVHEVVHGMSVTPKVKCPLCKKTCHKTIISPNVVLGKGGEVWDYDECHKAKPKWLKSKDGKTRVLYDPTKHGNHKGSEAHTRKLPSSKP